MKSRKSLTSKHTRIKVGITIGDPAGIGPIATMKALKQLNGLADFTVIGDSSVLSNIRYCHLLDLGKIKGKKIRCGRATGEGGLASLAYLNKAIDLLKDKKIDCLVTCPVSKEAINKAGFKFYGHTEYLAERFNVKHYAMILLNDYLKFGLVTRHLPLKDVSSRLTGDNLSRTILLTYEALRKLFFIKTPRLAVCAINPHASDNGVIGSEENMLIKPLINKLKTKIATLEGPLPAEIAIVRAFRGQYHCLIAMYHDQALIPLKLTERFGGVNLTVGLPFIRTSPLHGTAFDIANNPSRVDPTSLIEAIETAVECTSNLKKA
ncbi:MAG: 4-hydroxythreonine-4-phosphate dehydrogenase PdxA [Candidatus Omnitrophica bacterium]|nr:4-hydroxythreonine-4-phosphate dehydrogenase PdxA [Candidatus Omnitrophota bacterium]